jgi:hypothetical protein
MVLHETTGGKWFQVNLNGSEFMPYFETCFIKASQRKKDMTPVFVAPAKPLVFRLVFEEKVWNKIKALENEKVCHNIDMPNSTLKISQLIIMIVDIISLLSTWADYWTIGWFQSLPKAESIPQPNTFKRSQIYHQKIGKKNTHY